MNSFQNLLQEFQELNLKLGEYAITGSGPLAVRGIREAKDLDILVRKNIYEELTKKYPNNIVSKGDYNLLEIGNLEIGHNFLGSTEKTDEMIDTAEIIDGFAFVNLDNVLWFKNKLKREKDLKDIEAIEKYLKNI